MRPCAGSMAGGRASDWVHAGWVLGGGSLNTSFLHVIDQAYAPGPAVITGSLGHCSASFSTLRAGDETNLTLTIAPSARNAFAADLVLVFSAGSMVLRLGIHASVVSDTHQQSDMPVDVDTQQGAIHLSPLPPTSAAHNVSIRVQGLQNAPLSGPSGAFSLVLQLDEERRIDTCELGSRAIWAPAQDPLSTFACPASFYSDVELKLGIYTRRCLPCPQVPAFLPLPSPRLLYLLPVCDHDVFILPPTRVTRAPALDGERMYRQYSYSYF